MDNVNVTIREAALDDLPILLQFEQGIVAAERPFDPTLQDGEIHYYDLAEKVSSQYCYVVVIEVDSVVIGSGYAEIRDAKDYYKHDKFAYLGFMYIAPEHRGQGLNQKLIEALISWCKTQDVNEVRLDVYPENMAAISAYEKVGFKPQLLQMRLHEKDK